MYPIPSRMLQRLARKLSNWKYLALAGAIQAAPACTLMTETDGWPQKPPVTGQASPEENYKIPPTTKVLDEEWIAQLETITNEGTLVFPKNSVYGQSLEEGDIVIAGVSDKTPYGLLRRVGEIARREDIHVQTIPASLEEAVEEGSLRTNIDFSKAYLDQTQINVNTETRRDALRGELHEEGTMKIDFGNTELTSGIEINGYAQLTVGMDLEIEIKRFTLEHFKLGVTGNEKLALEFIAEYGQSYEKELPPVEPIPLKPFTVWAWGIPIVIFPHYSITLGFEAEARIDISAAIEQEARAEVALVYEKDTGFVPVSDFQNTYGLRYDPDFVGITGRGELFAKHKLLFAPYNIGGVFVSFRGGVGAEVTLEELVVYANLGVTAGAELRALRHENERESAEGEGEGEGEGWEIESPPMSIEIPLYSHRVDLLRKRLGGNGEEPSEGEGEPDCSEIIRRCSADSRYEEVYDSCGHLLARNDCKLGGADYGEDYECIPAEIYGGAVCSTINNCPGERWECADDRSISAYDGCGNLIHTVDCQPGEVCRNDSCVDENQRCGVESRRVCVNDTIRIIDECGRTIEEVLCEYGCNQNANPMSCNEDGQEGEGEPAEGEGQGDGHLQCGFTYLIGARGDDSIAGIPEFRYIGFMIPVFSYITGPGFNVDLNIQGENVTATFRRKPTEDGDDPVLYTYHGTLDGRILQMTSPPTVLRPRGVDCILTHESTWTGTLTQNRNGAAFSGMEVVQWYNNRGTYCPDDHAIQEHMETAFENGPMGDAVDRCE